MTAVELLAVGTELLYGDVVNTNAAWLGRRLTEAGLDVATCVVVGDDLDRIAATIRAALARADALVVTGGIGPTQDDLTRDALALAAGVPLVRDPDLETVLRARFSALRRDVPEMNYRQAELPAGAVALPNGRGSAPGIRMETNGRVVYVLPGVPYEMEAMFADSVLPDLLRRAGEPMVIVHRVLRTAGMWESAVAAALADQVSRLEADGRISVAFLASGGLVRVRLTARAATHDEALALLAPEEAAARTALGSAVYGTDADTLEGVIASLLRARSATVAVAESLTGGLLGAALTAPPGASDVFRGGVTAYGTDLKRTLLDVPLDVLSGAGAVSADAAVAMARGARTRLGATYGLALTGVAGPTEQEGKAPGTVHIGLAGPDGDTVRSVRLPGDRAQVRGYAVIAALNTLRSRLIEDD